MGAKVIRRRDSRVAPAQPRTDSDQQEVTLLDLDRVVKQTELGLGEEHHVVVGLRVVVQRRQLHASQGFFPTSPFTTALLNSAGNNPW